MLKTFEYRLYPTREQREALLSCLAESRRLYNEMLEAAKEHHASTGKFLFKYSLTARFKGCGGEHVPASTVQTLADRLDKAVRRYIALRELGRRVGFPRFKRPNRWHSIQLRQYGRGRDVFMDAEKGRLRVPKKLGRIIKIKQHRPLEGNPRTAYLVLRADGKWYVLIVCDLGEAPPVREGSAVGLDVGLKFFLADSEGKTVANPRHYRASQKRLRRKQRKTCRCNRGSKRNKKAARSVARTHLKIARQRKDFLHKMARSYVERHATIVVEDLNVCGMIKNRHLAKSIQDAGWSKFVKMLESKAESAGSRVIKVPPQLSTQRCSNCGETVPKGLSVRTHTCSFCGFACDRDVNAARNILQAGTRPSERNVTDYRKRAPRSPLP